MSYRWEETSHLEIYDRRPTQRFIIQTLGGQFPVLQKLQNGIIACVARGGDFHVGERGYLTWITSGDGGESWSVAQPLGPYGIDDRGPCLIQTDKGTLLVAFQNGQFYANGRYSRELQRQNGVVRLIRSDDLGHTWQYVGALPAPDDPEILVGALPFGKMVQLPDGTILLPLYQLTNQEDMGFASYILRSRDDGRTWGDVTCIAQGFNETQLLPLPSGKIIALLRNEYKGQLKGRGADLWQAESWDAGYTWTTPQRITDHREHPADLLRLTDGRVLLVYGHRVPPFGVRAMVSHDEGTTWDVHHKITLVAEATSSDCGYPSSVQRDDGKILTAYYVHESTGPFQAMAGQLMGEHCAVVMYDPSDLP